MKSEATGSFVEGIGTTSVYVALSEHQTSHPWDKQSLFQELHRWAGIFDSHFKLKVPQFAICVDHLHPRRYGHFRSGPNGFGLSSEIAINETYLGERQFWEVLGTLVHEQLHAWQRAHGKPGKGNYHNQAFRTKAESLGLIVDQHGYTQYRRPSPFTELLERCGIKVPDLPTPTLTPRRARHSSNLKKWSCGCTNVRVAIPDFRALCLKCGSQFEREW
jgi:hypothetical protein